MSRIEIIGAETTLALDDLSTWVAQREQTMRAPVVGIGDGGDNTAVSFDRAQGIPKKFAKVSLKVGATCVVAGDETLACDGQAYISGTLTDVCVTRPK